MNNQIALFNLSSKDLKRIIALKERIEGLQGELARLLGDRRQPAPARGGRRRGRPAGAPRKRKRYVSPAARARLSALAKARWAKIKRAGGRHL